MPASRSSAAGQGSTGNEQLTINHILNPIYPGADDQVRVPRPRREPRPGRERAQGRGIHIPKVCPICQETVEDRCTPLPFGCTHAVCHRQACFDDTVAHGQCPICRAELDDYKQLRIDSRLRAEWDTNM